MTDLLLHGHFYQPPRENPWTDAIDREPGARPHHDWNARIDAECYRPNAFARIVDARGRVGAVANNYEWLGFNFGPTLVRWLQHHDALTLARLVEADTASRKRLGHGNAMAQAYNHVILPLASPRDRATQIRWGQAAFEAVFGRAADGMWLPECAASRQVLDDLVDHGVKVVILAAHQAARVRPDGGPWTDVRGGKVATGRAYRHRHRDGTGRHLAVLFYDGELARSIAFGPALGSSRALLEHCRAAAERAGGGLVQAAFDGETAGHHHPWGDRALAHALVDELPRHGFRPVNAVAFVAEHPPSWDVEIDEGPAGEGTSWSCAHGVGRWQRDCGCRLAPDGGGDQAWRGPLREAVHLLRDRAAAYFEGEAAGLLRDPWAARDDYIGILLAPGEASRRAHLQRHGRGDMAGDRGVRALELLELQHQVMLASTSCGWFFDDIAGLEATQVLRYVVRAGALWDELGGAAPWAELRDVLAGARSRVRARGTGADLLDGIRARDPLGARELAAHVMMRVARPDLPTPVHLAGHAVRVEGAEPATDGDTRRVRARVVLEHPRTGRRHHLDACLEERPDDGRTVRVSVTSTEETAPVALALDDLLAGGGRDLLEEILVADLREVRRSTERIRLRWRGLPAAGAAVDLRLPPAIIPGLAAWDLDDRMAEAGRRDDGGEIQGALAAERAGLRLALGRPALAWLRQRVEQRLESCLGDVSRPGDVTLAAVRRLLAAARALGLRPALHRAQEAFYARFLHRPLPSPEAPASPRELAATGRALGFGDGLLATVSVDPAAPAPDGVREETR